VSPSTHALQSTPAHPTLGVLQLLASPTAPTPLPPSAPHILLVVDQFPRALGGGERIVLRLAALLPLYGYRVSILTFLIHPESSVLGSPPPCPLYLLPLERTYDRNALRAAFALRRFLRKEKVKIVQTFFESSDLWAGLVTKALSSAKLIWSRRDMGILRAPKHTKAYRLLRRFPDRVFAVSELVRRHGIEVDGIDPSRVETIYNGLDLNEWTDQWTPPLPTAKPSGEFLIATVGNIRPVKGHDVLIRAAAIVLKRFPDTTFTIAGEILEPEFFSSLQLLASTLGISDRIRFLGGVSDLRTYLASADLFVLPSRSEGFSNAIVEAMATALPVVATNVGGNAEAVQDQITGFIVPPDDPEALARAILLLLEDSSRARSMGSAGRILVGQRFTTDAMMRRITEQYAALLSH